MTCIGCVAGVTAFLLQWLAVALIVALAVVAAELLRFFWREF